MTTAALANYLIESVGNRVDLCESQGDQWITICRDISEATADRYGFNVASPVVQRVFETAHVTLED